MTTPQPRSSPFMSLVQHHERVWGLETYSGRPELSQILTSPVIAFWQNMEAKSEPHVDARGKLIVEKPKVDERLTITLHNDLKEIEAHIARLVIRSGAQLPKQYLARLFVKGREMRIASINIVFEPVDHK